MLQRLIRWITGWQAIFKPRPSGHLTTGTLPESSQDPTKETEPTRVHKREAHPLLAAIDQDSSEGLPLFADPKGTTDQDETQQTERCPSDTDHLAPPTESSDLDTSGQDPQPKQLSGVEKEEPKPDDDRSIDPPNLTETKPDHQIKPTGSISTIESTDRTPADPQKDEPSLPIPSMPQALDEPDDSHAGVRDVGNTGKLLPDAGSSHPDASGQDVKPERLSPLPPIGPRPDDDRSNDPPDLSRTEPDDQIEPTTTASTIESIERPPAGPLKDGLSPETLEATDQRSAPLDSDIGPLTPPEKSQSIGTVSAPRKIGARRPDQLSGPQSPKESRERRFTPRAELLCRKPRGSRRWEMIIDVPVERRVAEVYQDDNLLKLEGDEYVLSCFTGTVTITYEDGDSQDLSLYAGSPLIFKLPRNWKGVGRKVRGITKGHYIVIVPTGEHWSNGDPVEPEPCNDSSFIARYCYEDDSSENGPGGFDDELMLLGIDFTLDGTTVYDDSDHGDLFISSPPELRCSSDIFWARIGEEGREGQWAENFNPNERSIEEMLNGREGRFFIRVYDEEPQLQDSRDFRYHSDLQEIRVDDEPYSADTELVPSPTGHSETTIEFLKSDGQLVSPIAADTEDGQPSIGTDGTIVVPTHPDADRVSCRLPSDRGEVEAVIDLPRIWWRLDQEIAPWGDMPIQMTRKGFRDHIDAGVAIRLKLPSHVTSVSVGFGEDTGQIHRPPESGADTEIPLSAFAGYTQIDHRLEEDALLGTQWGDLVLTLIRVTADPVPKILDSGSRRSSIVKRGGAVLRQYELMTIHRPELTEGEYREKVSELSEFLASQGAVNQETDPWGKRRLAYKIDHVSEGYYTVNRFESEPATVDALRRVLSLADEVLRHKVIRPEN